MDPLRVARYIEKVDHARERLGQAGEWSPSASKDVKARLASWKAFQEAAEAASDLLAMAAVDSGTPSRDDYANIDLASELGVFPQSLAPALREATGLRNRLVHEYDGLDTARAVEGILRLAPAMTQFLEEVERWIRSRSA